MAYDLYPAVDESFAFPPEVRTALAASLELRNTVVPMTTAQRNNLAGAALWDGRLILNTTTDRLNRYDAGTAAWVQIADTSEVTALSTTVAALPKGRVASSVITADLTNGTGSLLVTSFAFTPVVGRRYKLSVCSMVNMASAGFCEHRLMIDGAQVAMAVSNHPAVGVTESRSPFIELSGLTATSKTFRFDQVCNTGTLTAKASAIQPLRLILEDIGT